MSSPSLPSPPSSSPCKKCGNEATLRCSRCSTTWYCSRDCQKNDWKRHKKNDCCEADVANVELLSSSFVPSYHLVCLHCCRNQAYSCACTGMTQEQHKSDVVFVMDPIPSHLTVMQRIQRWAKLVSYHPKLRQFDAERFVKDLPISFTEDLQKVKPVISKLMDKYKVRGIDEVARNISMPASALPGFKAQCLKDCDYVIENFFAGNWGYPTIMEFVLINNAIQQTGPEDFDDEIRPLVREIFECVNTIFEAFRTLLGQGKMHFRLEDVKDVKNIILE